MAPKQRSTIDDIGLSVSTHGLFVEGNTLCLEGVSLESLLFLSSPVLPWRTGKLSGRQVLVSDDAYEVLSKKFPKTPFLCCKYLHPITVGSLSLELLPSGEAPGSSFLLIKKAERSLMYVSRWNPEPHPSIRKAVIRPANRLLVNIENDDDHKVSPQNHVRHELERMNNFARQTLAEGKSLGLFFDPPRDLHRILTSLPEEFPIFADQKTLEFATLCAQSPSDLHRPLRERLKQFSPLAAAHATPAIFLVSTYGQHKKMPSATWVLGCSRREQRQGIVAPVNFGEHFQIAHTPSHNDILKLVSETKAEGVNL
jgi:hypothetical protein